jgi:hypothetical protein
LRSPLWGDFYWAWSGSDDRWPVVLESCHIRNRRREPAEEPTKRASYAVISGGGKNGNQSSLCVRRPALHRPLQLCEFAATSIRFAKNIALQHHNLFCLWCLTRTMRGCCSMGGPGERVRIAGWGIMGLAEHRCLPADTAKKSVVDRRKIWNK